MMQLLKGFYIEDDYNNVIVQQAKFSLYEGIELEGLRELPKNIEAFYPIVVERGIDFLLIDHELDKQKVKYKGSDALRAIRKHDSTIYAVLLTNYPLSDYKDELGAYDFQLTKDELKENSKLEELVEKIRRACELRKDNKMLAEMECHKQQKTELLQALKQIMGAEEKE